WDRLKSGGIGLKRAAKNGRQSREFANRCASDVRARRFKSHAKGRYAKNCGCFPHKPANSTRRMEQAAYRLVFRELVVERRGFGGRQHVHGNLPLLFKIQRLARTLQEL